MYKIDPMPGELINPSERHLACVMGVDSSTSTEGAPNAELNQGLIEFQQTLQADSQAAGCVDVSIINFSSSVSVPTPFVPAEYFEAPTISASGCTAMNEAIIACLDAERAQVQNYKNNNVGHYRSWFFLLTDGAATDSKLKNEATRRIREAIYNCQINFIPMGIGNADIEALKDYYPVEDFDVRGNKINKVVLKATANNFKEAFVWLSASLAQMATSNGQPGAVMECPQLPGTITIGT